MSAASETPMRDHVAGFWRLIRDGKVRILVDTYQPEGFGGAGHVTSSSFPDDVAKALAAEIERLRDAVWAAIPWLDDLQHLGSIVDHSRRADTLARLRAAVRSDEQITAEER